MAYLYPLEHKRALELRPGATLAHTQLGPCTTADFPETGSRLLLSNYPTPTLTPPCRPVTFCLARRTLCWRVERQPKSRMGGCNAGTQKEKEEERRLRKPVVVVIVRIGVHCASCRSVCEVRTIKVRGVMARGIGGRERCTRLILIYLLPSGGWWDGWPLTAVAAPM